ncbi:MAG: dihydrolipoyl dehydrogenase [Chlamydiia bacterium]|nr:dihydrolipoyl dehydrogenase [Chlamydiia bacterium]
MKYDVVVIGSGPGGYPAALRACELGLKVALIEKDAFLGGTCLNVGCIPSKTLLHFTELYAHFPYDLCGETKGTLDFAMLQKRKEKVICDIRSQLQTLFKGHHIDTIHGRAEIISPHHVRVNGQEIEVRSIILATGSEPIALPFLPFDEKQVVSSTGGLALEKVPESMIVIGAGVIGIELASVYARLKSKVTIIELAASICGGIDSSLQKGLLTELKKQGIEFHLSSRLLSGKVEEGKITVQIQTSQELKLQAEVVLVAVGRRPLTKNLGLEQVGVNLDPSGHVAVNSTFQSSVPSIYAIGDLIDGPMLAHRASLEGVAVAEIIAGKKVSVEYMSLPSVIYTYPEAASCGMTEEEIKKTGRPYKASISFLKANPRAYASQETDGFVKVIVDSKTAVLLGVHILAPHASELISIAMVAIHERMTASELGKLPFPHPTLSEAIKEACLMV